MAGNVFLGGIPTDGDIKRLRTTFPDERLYPGMNISYQDLESIIDCSHKSNRFKGITARWRKLVMSESGVVIGCRPGIGFVVLKDAEKVDASHGKMRQAVRCVRKSVALTALVDIRKLTEDERKRMEAVTRRAAAFMAAAQLKAEQELPQLI